MKDTYRHKGLRRQLVEELRSKGIQDDRILQAMEQLPRHFFLDNAFEEWAYQDKAFPIGNDQTISQPYTVAFQTELLELEERDSVLEIGTGSGYQAAILAKMGARVFTVERQEALYKKAKALLKDLQVGNVRCYFRDGTNGLPEHAPFDKVIVTAGADKVPEALKKQLTIDGMLVIPVGKKVQKMVRLTRLSETQFKRETFGDFRFVPFKGGTNKG